MSSMVLHARVLPPGYLKGEVIGLTLDRFIFNFLRPIYMWLYLLLVIVFFFRLREGMETAPEVAPETAPEVRLGQVEKYAESIDARLKKLEKDISDFQDS